MPRGRGAYYKEKYGGRGGRGGSGKGETPLTNHNTTVDAKLEEADEPLQPNGDLAALLKKIDGESYGHYKTLRGLYTFDECTLGIVHVQGDAYAAPSRVFFRIPLSFGRIPNELLSTPCRAIALADFLARRLCDLIKIEEADTSLIQGSLIIRTHA